MDTSSVITLKNLHVQTLGLCPEFLKSLTIKGPYLVWMQRLDFFICRFEPQQSIIEKGNHLKKNGICYYVDLHKNDFDEVVGFNTLCIGSARRVISHIFRTTKKDSVTLEDIVVTTNLLSDTGALKFKFYDEFYFYLEDQKLAEMRLSIIDFKRDRIRTLSRQRFRNLNGIFVG